MHRIHAASRRFKRMLVTLPTASFVFSLVYGTFDSALRSKVSMLEIPRLLSATAGRQVPLAKPESVSISFACCRQMLFTILMHSVATIHDVMRLCLGFVLHFDNTFRCAQEKFSSVGIKCKLSYIYLVPASHSRWQIWCIEVNQRFNLFVLVYSRDLHLRE